MLISGGAHNEIKMKWSAQILASMTAYHNDYYGSLDPSPPALDRIPIGMVLLNERLVDRDMLTRGEFWNDWANPNEYGDGIYSVLTRDDVGTSWLCAAAKAKPDPFGTPERLSLVQALVPHMQHAIKVQSRLSGVDRRCRDLVATLDLMSDGIAVVGRDGRVLHLNPAAESIVASRDGLCVVSGLLSASVAHADSALERAVHQALAGPRSDAVMGGCVAIPR